MGRIASSKKDVVEYEVNKIADDLITQLHTIKKKYTQMDSRKKKNILSIIAGVAALLASIEFARRHRRLST